MKNTLQKILRHVRKAGYAISAVIKRVLRRGNHPSAKQVATANIGTPAGNARRGAYHAGKDTRKTILSTLKPITDTVNKVFSKRSAKLIAAGGAAVVIVAVVLAITLSGAGSAAAANTEPADGSEVAVGETDVAETDTLPQLTPTAQETPVVTPVPTTAPEETPSLVPGCHDTRVIDVQEKLMELGYMGIDEPTDYYGSGTEYALQLFQRKHSLQVDGILGEKTLTLLFSNDAKPYTVKLGDKGYDVKNIQERLKELRYFSGEATGDFGDRTESAVKSFQKRNGLSPDGNVGENTLETLFSDDAKTASSGGGSSHGGGGGGGGGSSHGGGSTIATWEPDAAKADALIAAAEEQLGKKYVRGGKGSDTFDCSGLVYYCLKQAGYSTGYMTSGGWAKCGLPKVTSPSDMRRGDIVCFRGHVGIYLGGGQMIDASSTEGKVRISNSVLSSSYWKRNFICARRVF